MEKDIKVLETNESNVNINEIIDPNSDFDLFPELTKAIQPINNPLSELASASSAIIYYGFHCGTMRCGLCHCDCDCDCKSECNCDDKIILYNTLIENGGVKKYLFRNFAYIAICGLCIDNRFRRTTDVTFSSYKDYVINNGIEFAEMVKSQPCTLCGLCGFYLDVYIKNENRLAGVVKFRGKCEEWFCCPDCCKTECCGTCCYDYYYCFEILDHNRNKVYNIYAKQCCCNCFSVDCCGEINFTINNQIGSRMGKITCNRDCCPCFGICGYKCQYKIEYPVDCTPELKLTLINAVIAFDLFVL